MEGLFCCACARWGALQAAVPDLKTLPCVLLKFGLCVQGQLKSANVGDSGYMLLVPAPGGGRYELRYHTTQQEHSFGCPYQLGHYEGADAPEDAMLMTLPVSRFQGCV